MNGKVQKAEPGKNVRSTVAGLQEANPNLEPLMIRDANDLVKRLRRSRNLLPVRQLDLG